jgi:hypothetical protein
VGSGREIEQADRTAASSAPITLIDVSRFMTRR